MIGGDNRMNEIGWVGLDIKVGLFADKYPVEQPVLKDSLRN